MLKIAYVMKPNCLCGCACLAINVIVLNLKVTYFGWDYHGFAVQEITGKTIESELFRALAVTRLIEGRETSNYHRCGRTDKGVSAFGQIIVREEGGSLPPFFAAIQFR